MKLKLVYFAQISDITGKSKEIIDLVEGNTTEDLTKLLETMYPQLINSVYKIAVNQLLIVDKVELSENTEVALLPPFAGG
ncbi:MoaD/ThiS family protein [Paracrocinitomix mangrovi]|uniref:MoaD/ThiS family protein n=1 Tax=Paracrocinitomix mangrovi TaxID=2862509 RepID=UPI001C8D756A|nr:MoaD/ThiS family protein [Paracrocinitomix mangrovi]UKN01055.1 MoaD/ThiS family protein [Paracrocinitomix mangrovi]